MDPYDSVDARLPSWPPAIPVNAHAASAAHREQARRLRGLVADTIVVNA